jgi:hypothetical protein
MGRLIVNTGLTLDGVMWRAAVMAAGLVVVAGAGEAQRSLPVVAGWGVDTTGAVAWIDIPMAEDVRVIFRRWAGYLRSDPRQQAPTSLWSAEEQRRWPQYDLTASIAYHGFPATVLEIRSAAPEAPGGYVVKTLFASAAGPDRGIRPIALTRVYAIREGGQWVFSNALTHLTRDWRREAVGPITYVLEPGYPFDRDRAGRAVRFADSLAAAFEVPGLERLTWYLTGSPERLYRIMGVEWTVGGAGFGYASYGDRLIFSGDPSVGEDYRHEIAHFVLGPLQSAGDTHPLINEGVAAWLGGSMGRDFRTLMAEYAAYLRSRPEVTLDSVLAPEGPDRGTRPGGATLALMAFEQGGVMAVKDLLASGRSTAQLQAALGRILGIDWPAIAARWRTRALAFGG